MNLTNMNPSHIMIVGDPHENSLFLMNRAYDFRSRFPEEETLFMISCGDLGFYYSHDWTWWAEPVSKQLQSLNVVLLSIDGNHENHARLVALQEKHGCVPIETMPNIYWLPRGYRWEWQGRKWLACGGAHSVDRAMRTKGIGWFDEEEITPEQKHNICQAGETDVIVTHDCPIEVTLSGLPDPIACGWAYEDIHLSNLHRVTLQEIFNAVKPEKMFGGHFHLAMNKTVEMTHGPVEVTILDWSGSRRINTVIVNARTLEISDAW